MEAILLDDERESLKWVEELLKAGEDPNAFDHIAQTIPIEAAWREAVFSEQRTDAAVHLLLDQNADICQVQSLNFDILDLVISGSIDLTLLMLSKGLSLSWFYYLTEIQEKNCSWDNLLTVLLEHGMFDKIEQLMPHGVLEFIEVYDYLGDSPLSTMAMNGNRELAEWLLKHGANINAFSQSLIGNTPLDRADENHDLLMIEFLLQRGANPNVPTHMWITVTDRVSKYGSAKKKGHHDSSKDADLQEIKRMVLEASKKFPPPTYPNGTTPKVWPPNPNTR